MKSGCNLTTIFINYLVVLLCFEYSTASALFADIFYLKEIFQIAHV